jgi:hypothetical protein
MQKILLPVVLAASVCALPYAAHGVDVPETGVGTVPAGDYTLDKPSSRSFPVLPGRRPSPDSRGRDEFPLRPTVG